MVIRNRVISLGVGLLVLLSGLTLSYSPRAATISPQEAVSRTPPPPVPGTTVSEYPTWLFDGPEGKGFRAYLSREYRKLAKQEDNENHFEEAARFLARANALDRGEMVEPERLSQRLLPAYALQDLIYARLRLMRLFDRGARKHLPRLAARAQSAFDCWMEEQEENLQPQDVNRCRREFEEAVVRLETVLFASESSAERSEEVVLATEQPVRCPVSDSWECHKKPVLVYFAFGKADLVPEERKKIARFAATAKRNRLQVLVSAYADRAGKENYNLALSKRRLQTVVKVLEKAGISRTQIVQAHYYGELYPKVMTPDGVAKRENRRVELSFICQTMQSPWGAFPNCGL